MPKITLVVPCFNEEFRLEQRTYASFLEHNKNVHIFFVNDGSTDNTHKVLEDISDQFPDQVKVLNLQNNIGKGHAVREGVLEGLKTDESQIIGYLDADLATPFEEAIRLIDLLENSKTLKGILGSRVNLLGREIDRRFLRYLYSRLLARIIRKNFNISVYDTQCGAKFFKRDCAENIFKNKFQCKWLFDIELLIRSKHIFKGTQIPFTEEPLFKWSDKRDSKIRLIDYYGIFMEYIKLTRYYK